MTATTSFFLIVYSLLLYNFVSVDAASFTGVLPVTSTTFPTPHPVADSTSKMSSSAAASSLCATLRRSSRLSTRTSSPYFASKGSVDSGDNAPTSSRYFSEQDAGSVGDVFTDKIDRLKDNGKNSPKSTTKLDSSGDSISPAIKRRKKSNTSTSPTQKMQSATPQKISSKKAKSKGSSKKKESKIKPTIQRTQSFEPAWWGNVLSTASHPHVATNLSKTKAEYKHDQYSPIHTLILGTHPSIQSLTQNQYYGHPLNAFWYIAGDSLGFRRSLASSPKTGKPYVYYHDHLKFGKESILEYPQQLERLAEKGFALWDIIGECERVSLKLCTD